MQQNEICWLNSVWDFKCRENLNFDLACNLWPVQGAFKPRDSGHFYLVVTCLVRSFSVGWLDTFDREVFRFCIHALWVNPSTRQPWPLRDLDSATPDDAANDMLIHKQILFICYFCLVLVFVVVLWFLFCSWLTCTMLYFKAKIAVL